MNHGGIPLETLSDHGNSASTNVPKCFCSLAHKEDVNGELGEIQIIIIFFKFYLFLGELFGLES